MTGCEVQILKVVRELREATKKAISRKMAVSSDYVSQMCDSLVEDGFLSQSVQGRYRVTIEGKRALEPFKGRMQGTPLRGMGGIAVSIYP